MIRLDAVTVTMPTMSRPVLRAVDLTIGESDLAVVVGPTGAGKSTLLGVMTGNVPHGTGGRLEGHVTVAGRDTRTHPPRELADVVGVVGQDPLAGFVTERVEDELAYAMEQLGLPPATMRRRVEETLDLLGLAPLRRRALRDLSGGEQQRVAIGSVLTPHPRVLVLDEPTSALDPTAAEEVLATLTRLVHDLGLTVVIAEHRLERVVPFADVIVHVPGDGSVSAAPPAVALASTTVAPPVVRLGRAAGWDPLPLAVREARRRAGPLRERLGDHDVRTMRPVGAVAATAGGVTVRHDAVDVLRDVDLTLHGGQVVAVMGRNGSGKSTLLWALQGSGRRDAGTVTVRTRAGDLDPGELPAAEARRHVALVPQTASDLLYLPTVGEECEQADRESSAPPGTCRGLLDRLVDGIDDATHPRDLSEGQRLSLVLAVQLAADPSVVLLDEPTRGLDEHAKHALAGVLSGLAAQQRAVVVATHDVEFVAEVADRVVMLADGEVIADGAARDVVRSSPGFAPQVVKILQGPWLTVADVVAAMAGEVVA